MSDQFLAEVRVFPFIFAPLQWALCDGQILAISQNSALFSLIGTTYGGNGTNNFGLPDITGNVVVCAGQGSGLSLYEVGEFAGSQNVTLLDSENPSHNHLVQATNAKSGSSSPAGQLYGKGEVLNGGTSTVINTYAKVTSPPSVLLNTAAIGLTGNGLPHNNMMPSLTLSYCIALQGVFPQRS
jgi:microcystin-dependent protein